MIDLHSHILPSLDDGSKNTAESLKMLSMLSSQGIDTVVATPHFSAGRESVDEFLRRRAESYNELMSVYSDDLPDILLGAEVKFYNGISYLEGIESLKIGDSKLLLIEMPMGKWTEHSIKDLEKLSLTRDFRIVLAHVERYINYQSRSTIRRLLDLDIMFQVNASFFNDRLTRFIALSMLRRNMVHFIGSDCHNLRHRPPDIGKAYDLIKNKLGIEFISDYTEFHRKMLSL